MYIPHSINLYQQYSPALPNLTLRERLLEIPQVVDVIYTEGSTFSLTWDKELMNHG